MTPGNLALEFTQGDTFSRTLNFTDEAGDPLDCSTLTFEAQIREAYNSATAVDIDIDDGDSNTGVVVISLAPAVTATLTSGVWDLQVTDGAGGITTWLSGAVRVTPEVTR